MFQENQEVVVNLGWCNRKGRIEKIHHGRVGQVPWVKFYGERRSVPVRPDEFKIEVVR